MSEHTRIVTVAAVTLVILTGGTVAEQRARLPPPADCTDIVEGVWRSHDHFLGHDHWYITDLHISRVPSNPQLLTGHMKVHMWLGGLEQSQPPTCEQTTLRYKLHEDATGKVVGNKISFKGVNYRVDEAICGPFSGYNLDAFEGTIDKELAEFQSRNNDGGLAVNFPSVFRRVACSAESPDAPSSVEPPPFQPPSSWRPGGCGWW